jgi:DNA-binding NarL/FixJ family response regulator
MTPRPVQRPVKILIVDDHPLFRQGVIHVLSKEFPDAQFGEAGNGEVALASLRSQWWDIVLLDIGIPGLNGIEILRKLRHTQPNPPVLALSMHPEVQYAKEALRLGAAGYLTKSHAADALRLAVRKVLSGGKFVSPELAELLATDLFSQPERLPHETLSKREFQVMCGIGAGKPVSQVARELSLSVKTISTFRARVLRKMNMKSNLEIVRYSLQHSVVD